MPRKEILLKEKGKEEVTFEKDFKELSADLREFLTAAGYLNDLEIDVFENCDEDVLEIHAKTESMVDPLCIFTDTQEIDDVYLHQLDEMKVLNMLYVKSFGVHQITSKSIILKKEEAMYEQNH